MMVNSMTREEIQIQQIDINIAGLERRLKAIKKGKLSANTSDIIARYEQIIADLKGCRAWHERRLKRDKGTA